MHSEIQISVTDLIYFIVISCYTKHSATFKTAVTSETRESFFSSEKCIALRFHIVTTLQVSLVNCICQKEM